MVKSAVAPCASATPVMMRRMSSGMRVRSAGSNVRRVPARHAVLGMTLCVVPAMNCVTDSTTGIERIDGARDDVLQRGHDLRADRDRIDSVMWRCGVSAASVMVHCHIVGRGHGGAGDQRDVAKRHVDHTCRPMIASTPSIMPVATMDSAPPGDTSSACWKMKRISPASRPGVARDSVTRPSAMLRVPVVPARHAWRRHRRSILDVVLLEDRERVDVGAHRDRPPRQRTPQARDNAGRRGPADFQPGHSGQGVKDELRCLVFVK